MIIGIITFHAAPNHGAALQAFALQTYIEKLGHDAYFINYQLGGGRAKQGLFRWISFTPRRTLEKIHYQKRTEPFIRFQKSFLKISQKYYSDYVQLQDDPPYADTYICGSDQIWNPLFIKKKSDEHVYWLDFISEKKRCVAYAASFGVCGLERDIGLRYSEYAKKLYSISVREKDSISIMSSLGTDNVILVPDPTLLLSESEYSCIKGRFKKRKNGYLFCYILGADNDDLAMRVKNVICNKYDVSVFDGYRKTIINNVLHNGYIGPGEWLDGIRFSNCVLTNSYHATIFSILYHKKFIVLLREGSDSGMNCRIISLLEVVGLQHRVLRYYDECQVEKLCQEEIDWVKVDERVQGYRLRGIEFIESSLL